MEIIAKILLSQGRKIKIIGVCPVCRFFIVKDKMAEEGIAKYNPRSINKFPEEKKDKLPDIICPGCSRIQPKARAA